jgi:hypothetical protein
MGFYMTDPHPRSVTGKKPAFLAYFESNAAEKVCYLIHEIRGKHDRAQKLGLAAWSAADGDTSVCNFPLRGFVNDMAFTHRA